MNRKKTKVIKVTRKSGVVYYGILRVRTTPLEQLK